MTGVRPYPGYRDSGVDWLGALPENWGVSRVGFETWVRARLGWKGLKADEYVDDGYLFLSTPDIKGREIDYSRANRITEERYRESPEIMLRAGDVLLSKDGTLGTVNLVTDLPAPATVNSSIAVLTPRRKADGAYVRYLLSSEYMKNIVQSLKGGMGVPHLFQWDINRIKMPLPPLDEQRQIAAFLDRETAKIDALISKQEQLIETLRERRAAVVVQAVAAPKGAHGAVDKLGRRTRIGNGSTPSRDQTAFWTDGDFPWLNRSVVNRDVVDSSDQFVTPTALRECHLPIVPPGSLLVGLTGQGKTRGMTTRLAIEATISQHIAYVTPEKAWLSRYLLWALRAEYRSLRLMSDENGSTKGGLTCEGLKTVRVGRPPLDEQKRIADYLDERTAKIDVLIDRAQRFIELSKERRSALISAAVTGQIDVRGGATVEVAG